MNVVTAKFWKIFISCSLILILSARTAKKYDAAYSNTIQRITISQPDNPSGLIPVPDFKAQNNPYVYVPPGAGLLGAAIIGAAKGFIEAEQEREAKDRQDAFASMPDLSRVLNEKHF